MPWLLINGSIYQGPRDYRSLENLVGLLLLEKKQFTECPAFIIDPQKQYFARLETAKGEIILQLLPQQAPLAVDNFVFLARQGWYDGVTFHRVIPGYIAQSGDPSGSGFGTPGYAFPDDLNNLRFDQPGMLAMASPGPDSNGSQFFITYQANALLDGGLLAFGDIDLGDAAAGLGLDQQLIHREAGMTGQPSASSRQKERHRPLSCVPHRGGADQNRCRPPVRAVCRVSSLPRHGHCPRDAARFPKE